MAILNVKLTRGQPLLDVLIPASGIHLQTLQDEAREMPTLQPAVALIDTGAGMTCVDLSILDNFRIDREGSSLINTPSTGRHPVERDHYNVGIIVLNGTEQRLIVPNVRVLATDLSNLNCKILLGRDVLARCLLVYDGNHQSITLAY